MPKYFTITFLGLILTTHTAFAQKHSLLDSLRTIIIENATDAKLDSTQELTVVATYLESAKQANSNIDIILAYQQLAAINYRLGNTNKALLYYRLYSVEQSQQAITKKSKEQLLQDSLTARTIEALKTKIKDLENENIALKSSQKDFFEKNYWIFLGLKILIALVVLSVLIWIYHRLKNKKNPETKTESPSANEQLSSLLEETKEKLNTSEVEHDLSDILVQQITTNPHEVFARNKSINKKFLIYQPKKLSGGDGLYFSSSKQRTLIVVFDAPGYGATGGLLSSLIYSLIDELVKTHKIESPNLLLSQLETTLLKKFPAGIPFTGGINIGVCLYNASRKVLSYAAANMELFVVQKGIQHSIHGSTESLLYAKEMRDFDLIEVEITRNTNFYLSTNGYWQQQGGLDKKPLGKLSFEKTIESLSGQPIIEHKKVLYKIFSDWKGGNEQNDDILVLGFGF